MKHKDRGPIFPRPGEVTYEDRCFVLGQKGIVIWLTGLSGSGKSTISEAVEKHLNRSSKVVFRLDGDDLRSGINSDLGFSESDRTENIRRVAHIASLFQKAGIIVLCSFISPMSKMREMARSIVGAEHFIEVYVRAEKEVCAQRDPKGLYQSNTAGLTGVSSPYEEPESPDIILDTEILSVDDCVERVVEELNRECIFNLDPPE
ncbi:MAG: adenylyl-sulfate kinase [Oscillospiraceae bacterium]|nr:adenylyl-sulfate kinase [Oscillospiraceae bacterium]